MARMRRKIKTPLNYASFNPIDEYTEVRPSGIEGFCSVTLNDIKPGEEITENYSKYPLSKWEKQMNFSRI